MNIIFEFISKGNFVKVSAIDEKTLIEAVVITPAKISREEMQDIALKKLEYLIAKQTKKKPRVKKDKIDSGTGFLA